MSGKRSTRIFVCKKIWKRTMVIHWPWYWEKWPFMEENSPQGILDNIAEKMLVEFADSGCPIFRSTTPLFRGQAQRQRTWKTVDSLCCRSRNNWNFRMIVSAMQLCLLALSVSFVCYGESHTYMKRKKPFPRKRWDRCDGTIKFLNRAQSDQDRSSVGLWWPSD